VSPASLPEVITVAASSMDGKFRQDGAGGVETMYRWCVGSRDAGVGKSLPTPRTPVCLLWQEMHCALTQTFAAMIAVCHRSNTGACVSLFAPGVEIWSACGGASKCGDTSSAVVTRFTTCTHHTHPDTYAVVLPSTTCRPMPSSQG
jgi:hypothetical protein